MQALQGDESDWNLSGAGGVEKVVRLIIRRARASFDASFPIYALVGDTKVPLTPEQASELDAQALMMAGQTAAEIGEMVSKMLEADSSGAKPPLELGGLLAQPIPYDGSRTSMEIDLPEACDQCFRHLAEIGYVFDACTRMNLEWSWMCQPCFFCCGVGEGFGQLYAFDRTNVFLVLGL